MTKRLEFVLSNDSINTLIEELNRFYEGKTPRRELIKCRLAVEELLIFYHNSLGSVPVSVQFSPGIKRGVRITVEGKALDPFADEPDELFGDIMVISAEKPVWKHRNGRNIVYVTVPGKPISYVAKIMAAIVLALALGTVMRAFCPGFGSSMDSILISQLADTAVGIMRAASVPLIFMSIFIGIINIGDIALLGRLGRGLLLRLLAAICTILLCNIIGFLPFFSISGGGANELSGSASGIIGMLLDIIPDSFFSPFTESNPMQVIVIAIVCGVSVLMLGERVRGLVRLMKQVYLVVEQIMTGISTFIPFVVFIILLHTVLGGDVGGLERSGTIVVCVVIGCALSFILDVAYVCIRLKLSPVRYLKMASESLLVAFTTASTVASIKPNMENCESAFGVSRKFLDFGVPISQMLYKSGSGAVMMGLCIGVAICSNTPITVSWLIVAYVICILMSVAMPPIPGSAAACYSMLFANMGLSADFLSVAIAVGILLDCPITMTNMQGAQAVILATAEKLGMREKRS